MLRRATDARDPCARSLLIECLPPPLSPPPPPPPPPCSPSPSSHVFVAPEGVYSGQFIYSGAKAEVAVGNILPVGNLVEGAFLPISFANDAAM